jgi:hypothetical protein
VPFINTTSDESATFFVARSTSPIWDWVCNFSIDKEFCITAAYDDGRHVFIINMRQLKMFAHQDDILVDSQGLIRNNGGRIIQ